jgi:aminopeptidase
MMDPRITKLADMMVNYSVAVQPGEKVLINGDSTGEPLILEIYKKVIQAGGHPILELGLHGTQEILYRNGSDEQLSFVSDIEKLMVETINVEIGVMAEINTKALSTIDPGRQVIRRRAREALFNRYLERAAKGEIRWTLTLFPTQAYAQEAEMSLEEYENFVYSACMPDPNNPVGYWKKFSARQAKIVDWLKGKQKVHVIGPNTDLRLNVAGKTFINCDCHENVPDGEVFTGPVEDSMEGHVRFSFPAIYSGREVTGVELWFEGGKVVKACAEKNEEFLLKTLDTDEGARRVGEFAIGTNEGITRFTKEILFDEKIGGSFHMALGAGYPETGSKNKSAIHWDMICDLRQDGEIWVDDELMYQNGHFVLNLD